MLRLLAKCGGVAFLLAACASQHATGAAATSPSAPEQSSINDTAEAVLQPLGDSGVTGQITFTQVADGVRVEGVVSGLGAGTKHGFHVHEFGDCSATDGLSAGGHFNPTDDPHGALHDAESHIGDLGNLAANDAGVATVAVTKAHATVSAGDTAYKGRSIIVHAEPDDLTSQPTGAAGGRIACGVIQ